MSSPFALARRAADLARASLAGAARSWRSRAPASSSPLGSLDRAPPPPRASALASARALARAFRAPPAAPSGAGDGVTPRDDAAPPSSSSSSSSPAPPSPSPRRRAPAPRGAALGGSAFAGGLTDAGDEFRVRAVLRKQKGSPKKFNAVLRLVRGLRVDDAVAQLSLSPKRYADVVRRVVQSAAANATNNHDLDREKLVIAEAVVGKGVFQKMVSIHGRGRAGVMHKPKSHVRIEVAEREAPEGGRRMRVRELEAPWKRRRRDAMRNFDIARRAGLA